jgi:hypothetical protein
MLAGRVRRPIVQLRRRGQLIAHCLTLSMRLMYAALLLMVSGSIHAQSTSPNAGKLCAVIFDVTVNSTGKVETLKVAKVIDPSTHTTDAVNVAVPDSYLSAAQPRASRHPWLVNPARTSLCGRSSGSTRLPISSKRHPALPNYGADSTHFNAWLFYDPARPNRADIDPQSGRP